MPAEQRLDLCTWPEAVNARPAGVCGRAAGAPRPGGHGSSCVPRRVPRRHRHGRRLSRGGVTPSSTRSIRAASRTRTAMAPVISTASRGGSTTCRSSASMPSGSRPSTPLRRWTSVTTSPTTQAVDPHVRYARGLRSSARARRAAATSASFSTWCSITPRTSTRGSSMRRARAAPDTMISTSGATASWTPPGTVSHRTTG